MHLTIREVNKRIVRVELNPPTGSRTDELVKVPCEGRVFAF
jgi:hypothetical protein